MSARMLEISRSYDLIGLLNAYTGNWTVNINNQVKNYLEAEKYAKASGDQNQIATVIFHMGISLKSAGKLDSALILLTKARSMFSDLKDPQLGRAYMYLGETYEARGDLSMARSTLLQALLHLNATNDNVHRGLAYMSLSRIYAGLSKTDSALYCALESFRIFEKRRDAAWKRDAGNMLAVYYDQLGKADSATLYLKLAKSLSDSLSIEERKNLLAFQDILIDEQTKLEKLEKERIEAREKMRTYLLMSGIALFLAIALLLYRNNRVRKRTNEMLQQRNEKIENTLHRLRSTQAQLIQSEKMASLGELTAGIAHEIQNPLNFVNNFSEASSELIDEMKDKIRDGNYEEVNAIADDVKQNLEKIGHHGKRADNIVKGMLQHSRRSSGQKEYVNINSLCEEYVRLAYHGFHARNNDSSVQLVTELDPALPKVPIIPQDIGRVILNLLNNAFYYALEGSGLSEGDHQPKVILRTQKREKNVAIIVEDNGKGIPESIKDKIFQPFFTTKPTGQGTGLGLSLSYDIVKAHGGELTVETKEGQGTTFFILLPLS
jgi:signal transduction histidine kinase